MDLLLFSNSTNVGEAYFAFPLPYIGETIKDRNIQKAVFIPFAAVGFSYDKYENKVAEQLKTIGLEITGLHKFANKAEAIQNADCIIVGGGNTFHLLKELQTYNLLHSIKEQVLNGALYIGWSAGANLACPTIKTTNDMPIVEVNNFEALHLIPFQINPHYTKASIQNHGGETRDARINEFITANKNTFVIGLPEGTMLNYMNHQAILLGDRPASIFHSELKEPQNIECGSILELPAM